MEKVKEITLVFHLNIQSSYKDEEYIFSYGEDGLLLSAFVKNGSVFFGIPKADDLGLINNNELVDFISIEVPNDKNIPIYFLCSYERTVKLEIWLGDNKVAEKLTNVEPSSNYFHSLYKIGANFEHKSFGRFFLYETMAYQQILTADQIKQLNNYFSQKNLSRYIYFDGNSFLFKDLNSGNLIQLNPDLQPKYIGAE